MLKLQQFQKLGPGMQRMISRYLNVHCSQFGEDVVLGQYLSSGFLPPQSRFIDIGCYHPIQWSNTYFLYLGGWRGINIDANEEAIELQKRVRPHDINICTGIAEEEGEYTYYNLGMEASNTIIPEYAEERVEKGSILTGQKKIYCRKIMSVLRDHINEENKDEFSYVNIDLEGLDEVIVSQIDWDWLPVKLVTVEMYRLNVRQVLEQPICQMLEKHGFVLEHFLHPTAFFARRDIY